jgi:hypothetical protein
VRDMAGLEIGLLGASSLKPKNWKRQRPNFFAPNSAPKTDVEVQGSYHLR